MSTKSASAWAAAMAATKKNAAASTNPTPPAPPSSVPQPAYPASGSAAGIMQVAQGQWNPDKDPWSMWRDTYEDEMKQQQVMKAFRHQLEQLEQARRMAQQQMTKEQMLQGVLKEMIAMRANLDRLTALVSAEILTDRGDQK